MKLTKINYVSAAFFGVFAFFMYLAIGVFQWIFRDVFLELYAFQVTALSAIVLTPISGAVVGYLTVAFAILIYNTVAKKYPISWEVKK